MLTKEVFKDIPGFNGLYRVSSVGNVFSVRSGRVLKLFRNYKGYLYVTLSVAGISFGCKVHRLVLLTFIGPCPEGKQAAHLNGNPSDNSIDNLAWVTGSENCKHKRIHGRIPKGEKCGASKLREKDIHTIRMIHKEGMRTIEISLLYKIGTSAVRRIVYGRTWSHVPTLGNGKEAPHART